MSNAIERNSTRIALRVSRDRNRRLLAELLDGHDVVEFSDTVPDGTDLCIVDDRGISQGEHSLIDWKRGQRPIYAPVLLLSESGGTNLWQEYDRQLGKQIDAIQPIPAPKMAIQSRVESLIETRAYSQELANERQLVNQIFETTPIAKAVLDTDGNIVRANQRAETVLGLSESELSERAYDTPEWRIIDEDGDPIPSEELPFSRVSSTGEPVYGYEHGIERPNGERVWLSINMGPIFDEHGEIEYLVSSIEDVTERKRLERELRESEELHRATLSNITDTVFITDEDGQFTYVCPNVNFIFGYEGEEVREMGTVEALLGSDPAPNGVAEGEVRKNINMQVTDVDGDEHDVLVTVNPVSIQDGTRLYSVRDVTDLVESEQQLERERERIEAVVSNAPLMLTAIDSDGTITLSKGRQLEHIGLEPGELVGKTVAEAFDDLPEIRDNAERVLDGESFWTETHVGDRYLDAWHQPVFEDGTVTQAIIVAQDVTDRKRQDERFQAFVEGSSDIITVLDSDGVIEYVSPSVERILGYDPDELVGESAFEKVHPEDRDSLLDGFESISDSEDGETFTERYRTKHADGSWRWTESRTTMRPDMVQGMYVVNTRDVTEQVEVEQKLRRTEESRSLALKAAQAGVWEWNLQTGEVMWDEAMEALYGINPDTFEGTYEAFTDYLHPDDLPAVEAAIQQSIEEDEAFHTSFRIIRDDGVEHWVEGRGTVVPDGTGTPERLLGVNVDITERKKQEREIRRTQRAIEASGHAIYITSPDGVIEYVNPAFEEITGYASEDVIGETPKLLNSEKLADDYYTELWATITAGEIWEEEIVNERKDGSEYHAAQTIAPITDENDAIEGFVAIQTDITEHKDRLQQLRVMDRVLRHNLQNDMNVVRGFAEMVRLEGEGQLASYGDRIIKHSDHLLNLTAKQRKITEVLSSEPHLGSVDTVQTIRRTVESISEVYPDAKITHDLPDGAMVEATANLGQAIEELVTNAIEHADQDEPEVTVQVTDEADTVQIRIADTGSGIPEMDRRVVLGEHEIDPLYHGSGLGLWLVSWIIRRSNGTLWFEDNEPRGSVVVITLHKPTDSETGFRSDNGGEYRDR